MGAVVAQAQVNSAVAGAAGAGTGELIAAQLYPGIKTENLSEKQRQTVSALSTLASGLAGGLAGGDLSGAVAGAKAGNNAVENNSMGDIAIGLAEGKTLEQKAEERIKAENERYKEQNCAGLSAQACSAQMYEERRESLAYTLAGGAVLAGAVAGGMLLGPALLNACGMNPVACTELTIAAVEVPFGAATAGGAALGVGGFGSLGLKEVAATADAAAAARNVETVTGGALGPKGLGQTGGAVTSGTTLDLFSATRGKDLSKLTNQQVSDLGEDISKVFLRDNNHTDIFAVQNRSGNGIDIVSRTPDGRLAFTEVKTSRTGNVGDLSVRQQNMTTFIEDVLGQAASRQGRYKSISVAEQQQARQMLREFRRAPENVSGNLIGVDLQGEVLRVSPWARN
ncbi:VENN motif pre-toxin domain-containing protein [Pseudomonas rhodesiae]|uniref:VENN motif pre-toxin domain-containing protein n=1 Tax=Pseudomonas rhodesiae TaxID=76760 RepID=UPI00058ECEAF|nr:VENN motif pre-toxin domain-containing protein [Pseudomonas rhodesiae]